MKLLPTSENGVIRFKFIQLKPIFLKKILYIKLYVNKFVRCANQFFLSNIP